jgi:hypothetical protein
MTVTTVHPTLTNLTHHRRQRTLNTSTHSFEPFEQPGQLATVEPAKRLDIKRRRIEQQPLVDPEHRLAHPHPSDHKGPSIGGSRTHQPPSTAGITHALTRSFAGGGWIGGPSELCRWPQPRHRCAQRAHMKLTSISSSSTVGSAIRKWRTKGASVWIAHIANFRTVEIPGGNWD